MFSKRIFYEIFFHVLLILLVAGVGLVCIFSQKAIIFGTIFLVCALFQIQFLVAQLNKQNRRITLFFDAIQDHESTLLFPEQVKNKEQRQLHIAFNRINRLISETKLKSREQEDFYKALLESSPGGVISWDNTGRITVANRVSRQLLNCPNLYHRSQLIEINPEFCFEPDNPPSLIQIATPQGNRQLSVTSTTMRLHEQTATLLALQDIHEALSEKETESWNRLTHTLTHEIMNSIAPITSLSEMLSGYFEINGTAKKQEEITDQIIQKTIKGLNIMQRRGNSLLHFTDAYRKLTALPQPEIQPFPLKELLNNLCILLQPELEENHIRLVIDISPVSLILYADENQLSQVMINLLKNAIQALAEHPNGEIRIFATQNEQTVIEVIDNGPGIPALILENIFVPFFTTKSTGSGIGLNLSRQIIHQHKGQLQATSVPDRETRFIITLPN